MFAEQKILCHNPKAMMMKTAFSLSLVLSTALAHPDYATKATNKLVDAYMADCQAHTEPHGFYGAFLQPCTFDFYQDGCDGTPVGSPVPMHWYWNVTKDMDSDDWSSDSFDSFDEIADKLMLWPDQCVGVASRCYGVNDEEVADKLQQLFPDGIPIEATHVQVDCTNDAMQLSNLVYAAADGFEKSTPTLIMWFLTLVVFAFVSTLACCYGCCLLCKGGADCYAKGRGQGRSCQPGTSNVYVTHYERIEGDGDLELWNEKTSLKAGVN